MVFQPANWAESFNITVDNTKINEDLENFPVLVTLTSGTGQNGFDASNIFDAFSDNVPYDEYDSLIFRMLVDSSNSKHTLRLDSGVSIVEPGPVGFDVQLDFDGSTRANMGLSNSADWVIEGSYTIEFFMRSVNSSVFDIIAFGDTSADNLVIRFNDSYALWVYWDSTGSKYIRSGAVGDYSDGLWRHFALVREVQTFKFYVDGVEVGRNVAPTTLDTDLAAASSTIWEHTVGAAKGTATKNLDGSLAGIRISKTARYTEGFVPPIGPHVKDDFDALLIQDKVDYSNNKYDWKIFNNTTYPAAPFGSADGPFGRALYKLNNNGLYTEDNLDNFRIGINGDSFTIDAWMCADWLSVAYRHVICGLGGASATWSTNGYNYWCGITSTNDMCFYIWDGATSYTGLTLDLASDIRINTWNHYAIVNDKDLGLLTFYFNGRKLGTTTAVTGYVSAATRFCVGITNDLSTSYSTRGGIAELRVSPGAVRWVDEFEPPKSPYGDSWHNRKKIAVTTTISGVETELYAEIQDWHDGIYITHHVPQNNGTWVNSTTEYSSSYYNYYAVNQYKAMYDSWSTNAWLSNSTAGYYDQKFNIDYGRPVIADRVYLENAHAAGSSYWKGIKNFKVYGTNSSAAFANVTYDDLTSLVELGSFRAAPHQAVNTSNATFYYLANNGVAYRYYVLRIADNFDFTQYMAIRHIAMQEKRKEANLWVKIPEVSSVSGTQLTVYYDKTQDDNIYQIGDSRDDVSNYVWDSDFVGVWHMAQVSMATTPFTTDAIIDSTVNDTHLTTYGNMYQYQFANVVGKIGQTYHFDGSNDYAQSTITPPTVYDTGITFETIVFPFNTDVDTVMTVGTTDYNAICVVTGPVNNFYYSSNGSTWTTLENVSTSAHEYSYRAFAIDDSSWRMYSDTTSLSGTDSGPPSINVNTIKLAKAYSAGTYYWGSLSEARISKTARSDAWLKATYYSNYNDLLTYEVGQIVPYTSYIFSGTVEDYSGYLADIPVRLYRRSDGQLISETTSTASGTFQLLAEDEVEHYITAFNPNTGVNAVIYDWITPSGVIL
jgi:hypothetical protein